MKKVIIVTNTSKAEASWRLKLTGDWSPIQNENTEVVFVSSVKGLLSYTNNSYCTDPVLFMFFHGLEFIENTISSLIELSQDPVREFPLAYATTLMTKKNHIVNANHFVTTSHFKDMRFYFDLSIVEMGPTIDFCDIATMASLVLSKAGVLCDNRSLYIDDTHLVGGKDQPTRCLLRSFPGLDLKLGSGIY